MSETIASGRIEVNLDDRSALAGLDRIEAEYERTMKKIDAMEAEAEVGIDKSEFDRDAAAVAATLKKLDGKQATIDVRAKIDELKKDLKQAEAVVKSYDERIEKAQNNRSKGALRARRNAAQAEVEMRKEGLAQQKEALAAQKRTNAELTIQEQRIAAIQRREDKRAKAMAAEDRRRASADKARNALMDKAERLMDRAETKREQIATRRARDEAQQKAALQREMDAVPKLQRRYVELAATIDKLNQQRRKSRDEKSQILYTAKIDEVLADREQIKKRLKDLDIDPIDVGVRLTPGNDFGTSMRQAIGDGYRRGGLARVAINSGILIGGSMADGIVGGVKRNLRPGKIAGDIGDFFIRAGNALGNLSVRIGPFTATIKQAIVGLSLLGPILVDIIGAAGALVGVMGSAVVGVGALTAGFLGGAIPALFGFGFVIKDVAQEFTAAKKATKAYNDAVMKNGEGSDQAKKKMKELKTVMGNVSETTAKQFVNAQKLGSAWDKATKTGRASVWKGIGEALQTASDIMPQFAKRTNEGLGIAEKGISRMMKAVRSKEGKGLLDNLMGNFNSSLGPILSGLGNLVGYLGRVASVASDSMPGIARSFDKWSESLLRTSDNTDSLRERVNKTIQSAKDVGRFFMAAGRLAKAFFGGGVTAGQSFVNTMTNAMNRWTMFLNSADGQNKLGNFFKEAVAGAQAFWSFLQPIITTFVRWAALLSPVARGFFEIAGGAAQLTAAFIRLTGLQGPLSALLMTLGVLWGVSRIAGATRAVIGFTRALLGLSVAQKASAVAAATGPGALVMGAPRAASDVDKLAKSGSKATRALSGLGFATLGLANPLVGLGIVAGVAGFGLYKFITRTRDYEKAQMSAQEATKAFGSAASAMTPIQNQLAQSYLNTKSASLQVSAAEKEVNRLRKAGMTNTDEYSQAVLNLRQAELGLIQSKESLKAANVQETQAYRTMNNEANKALAQRNKQVDDLGKRGNTEGLFKRMSAEAKESGKSLKQVLKDADYLASGQKQRIQEYSDALGARERAERRVNRAVELSFLATLNHSRAMRGLSALTQNTAGHFARLAKLGGKNIAQKVAVKFTDSGDAARVARSASATLKSGVPSKLVTKIVADSKSAEDAVKRLQLARLTPKRLEIIERGGKAAVAMLERIIGRRLTRKEQNIAQQGGARVLEMLGQIIGRRINPKTLAISQRGGFEALGTLNAINAFRIAPKSFTVTEIRNIVETGGGVSKKPPPGSGIKTGKAKGSPGNTPGVALIGEGAADEWQVDTRTGEARKTNGPEITRLRPEDAIIPTEPKYRQRGKAILKSVAKDLGLDMFAGGKKPAKKPAAKNPNANPDFGSMTAEGFKPKVTVTRNRVFKPSKKNKKPYTARRGWSEYIEGLHTQQGYWEREVSIRESQVKEPANMVIETGTQDVKDPTTGEITKVPVYAANPEIESSYKPALAAVLDAMRNLMTIIVELVRAIPQALSANQAESGYHKQAKDKLDDQITRQNRRVKNSKGKQRDKHERELDRLKERRDKHIEARKELTDSEKTLKSDFVEAGFDQREATIAKNNLQTEHDTASGEAAAEAVKQTAAALPSLGGAGGGGSSGADAGPSLREQEAMADSERANVLREFGGNMLSILGTRPTGSGPAGSGPGAVNPAGIGGVAGAGVMLDSGGARSASGASFAGGNAAEGAVSSGAGVSAPVGATTEPMRTENKTVNIVNNFQQPPPEPHTFVQGMEFEAAGSF